MPTERSRHELYETCREHLGEEAAETLMELLPPVGWADVATKHDLDHLGALLRTELHTEIAGVRAEIADLRGALHTEIAGLRGELQAEIAGIRGELHTEIAGLRGELRAEIAGVRADMATLESRLTDKMSEQTRALMLAIVGSMVTISGVAFGAARLAV